MTGKKRELDSGNGSNLLDFTDSLRFGGYGERQTSPTRRTQFASPRPGSTDLATTTPQRPGSNLSNILDFDIPPAPTPRSVPTITPRELETLKSGFLSEISSLKASLSGKEAEVTSLKTAVSDAEKRVGECMERLHEVESMHESLEAEKNTWERRGREMEAVLRKVKEEIVLGQREREELEFKLDEAEKRREAAEMMAQDAESKMAGMRAGKASAEAAAHESPDKARGQPSSNKEVEMAVERVARELHALYKSKHETKVAALKKSYESRWEKKVRDLQAQVDELSRENEELRKQRDQDKTALATLNPARLTELEEERKADRARNAVQIREFEAEVEKLVAILDTVKNDNDELRALLEQERIEKGELVRLAEEMMAMQQEPPTPPAPAPAPTHLSAPNGRLSDRRGSDVSSTSNGDSGHHVPQPASKIGAKPRLGLGGPGAVRASTKTQSASGIAPPSGMEGAFRAGGVGRPTSMRAPAGSGLGLKASAGSRISGLGGHGRAQSATTAGANGVSGLPRPGSGMGLRGSGTLGSGGAGFGGGTGGYRGH
ncbi:central kinetochore-associated-domain-containing protein [Sordaria brevicollis]|uniref:Central kinetochore-associated-domain-containing protein n=1 Tax=Sordaria brevicollis TaxID=83679 RepID=A0AAE0PN53_SORBR|nr:central kinetochore-associated-domain-containing protein [Sordaria brevicollis]